MNIQAELSLYPLRTDEIVKTIEHFITGLSSRGLSVRQGTMSTLVFGERDEVFKAIAECFSLASETNEVVLVAKFSNACPTEVKIVGEQQSGSGI